MTVPHHSEAAREAVARAIHLNAITALPDEVWGLLNKLPPTDVHAIFERLADAVPLSASPAPAAGGLEALEWAEDHRAFIGKGRGLRYTIVPPQFRAEWYVWRAFDDDKANIGGILITTEKDELAAKAYAQADYKSRLVLTAALASPAATSEAHDPSCALWSVEPADCDCARSNPAPAATSAEAVDAQATIAKLADELGCEAAPATVFREALKLARDAAPSGTATSAETQGGDGVREDIAKIVYAAMKWAAERAEKGRPPGWVDRGNSLAQVEARRFAHDIAALAPSTSAATRGERECEECSGTGHTGIDGDEVYDCPVCLGEGVAPTPPAPAGKSAQVKEGLIARARHAARVERTLTGNRAGELYDALADALDECDPAGRIRASLATDAEG